MKAEWHLTYGGDKITEDFLEEPGWDDCVRVKVTYRTGHSLPMWEWLDARGSIFLDYRVAVGRIRDKKIQFKATHDEVMNHWVEFHDPSLAMQFKLVWG